MPVKDCFRFFDPLSDTPLPDSIPSLAKPLLNAIVDVLRSRTRSLGLTPKMLGEELNALERDLRLTEWFEETASHDGADEKSDKIITSNEIIERFENAYPIEVVTFTALDSTRSCSTSDLADYERHCLVLASCLTGLVINHYASTNVATPNAVRSGNHQWLLSEHAIQHLSNASVILLEYFTSTRESVTHSVLNDLMEEVLKKCRMDHEPNSQQSIERLLSIRHTVIRTQEEVNKAHENLTRAGKNSRPLHAPVKRKCIEIATPYIPKPHHTWTWSALAKNAFEQLTEDEREVFQGEDPHRTIERWLQREFGPKRKS